MGFYKKKFLRNCLQSRNWVSRIWFFDDYNEENKKLENIVNSKYTKKYLVSLHFKYIWSEFYLILKWKWRISIFNNIKFHLYLPQKIIIIA